MITNYLLQEKQRRSERNLPNALWYRSREDAISYARLLGQDCSGEIRVIGREATTDAVIPLGSVGDGPEG